MRRAMAIVAAWVLVTGAMASSAVAATGDGKYYYLNNALQGGAADETFAYGKDDDVVFVGDWDGDGDDTLGVRRGATYYLTNGLQGGAADVVFTYGRDADEVFLGDWDGDGVDTPAVRRGRTYYVTNQLRGGAAESVFVYGRVGDVVLVGDWDGDGDDTFAVRRGRTYYVNNALRGGVADVTFDYGRPDDLVYVGDWDGDGDDTLGVRREATYFLNNSLRGGAADRTFTYGRTGDVTLVGDWDGNGGDTLGVRRAASPPKRDGTTAATAADIGDTVSLPSWDVRVDAIDLDADQAVLDANIFNEPPVEGNYALVSVTATYTGADEGDGFFELLVVLQGADARQYADTGCDAVAPDDMLFEPTVITGGTVSGNFCLDYPDGALGPGAVLYIEEIFAFSEGNRGYWRLPRT